MSKSLFARAARLAVVLVPVVALAVGSVLGQSALSPGVLPVLIATSGEPATAPMEGEEAEQVAILEHDSGEPILRCVKEAKHRKKTKKKKKKTVVKKRRKSVYRYRYEKVPGCGQGRRRYRKWWSGWRWVKYKVTYTTTTTSIDHWSDWSCVPKCPSGPMKGQQCVENPDSDDSCLICPPEQPSE